MDFSLGEIVSSKAGRDAGRILIVVKVIDEEYILISDGDLRKIEKPKKKKTKHVKTFGIVIQSLNSKLSNNIRVSNAELKKEIGSIPNNVKKSKSDKEGLNFV